MEQLEYIDQNESYEGCNQGANLCKHSTHYQCFVALLSKDDSYTRVEIVRYGCKQCCCHHLEKHSKLHMGKSECTI